VTDAAHAFEVREPRPRRHQAVCICGYKSTTYSIPGDAKAAGEIHLRRKGVPVG